MPVSAEARAQQAQRTAEATLRNAGPQPAPTDVASLLHAMRSRPSASCSLGDKKARVDAFCAAVQADAPFTADAMAELTPVLQLEAKALGPAYAAFYTYYEAQAWVTVQRLDLALERLLACEAEHPELTEGAGARRLYLADLLRHAGRVDEAMRMLERVEATQQEQVQRQRAAAADATDALVQLSCAARTRAEVLRDTGRLEAAAEAVQVAIRCAADAGHRQTSQQALAVQIDLLLMTNRSEEARRVADDLLTQIDPDDRATRGELLVSRGYAESSSARANASLLPVAIATLRQALDYAQGPLRLRAELKLADLGLRAGDLQTAATSILTCAASSGHDLDSPRTDITSTDGCELVTLQTRLLLARGSAEALALRRQSERQVAAVEWLTSDWAKSAPTRDGIGFLYLPARREVIATAIAVVLAAAATDQQGAARSLQLLLDLQAQASVARARHTPRCSVEDLRRDLLARDRGALVYLPSYAGTYVFAVDGDGVAVETIDGDLSRNADIRNLVNWATTRPTVAGSTRHTIEDGLRHVGARVATQVLPAKLRRHLQQWNAVTIVGSDLLGDLPFEILLDADGQMLGETMAVDHSPSLPWSVALRQSQQASGPAASVQILASTAPQPWVAEAHGLDRFEFQRAALGELPADTRWTVPAALADLQRVVWHRHGVVHLVAHGVRAADRHNGLGLAWDDGVLWQRDLERIPCDGVVLLSACGASRGASRFGEGTAMATLAGTFLWQGAVATLVSRNELLAAPHLAFMGEVHRGLAAGLSVAAAARAARAGMGGGLFERVQHGLVQVIGDGHAPRARQSPR